MILIGRGLDQEAEKQGRLVSTTDREEPKEPLDTDLLRTRSVQVNSNCAVVKVRSTKTNSISGDDGERDPPVPIPNTEVKPLCADGTWLETARESRTLPDSK